MDGPIASEGDPPLVQCESVTVDYDATRAVDNVSLALRLGEVVGLVGPNGAGKSTLGRVIAGEIPADAFDGHLQVAGEEVSFRSARDAHGAGIVLIHQERATVNELSIGENVMLAIEPRRGIAIDWTELHRRAREHLLSLGLDVDTHARVADAGVAVQQLVDVARALAMGRRLFIFDESTAALGVEEVQTLLDRVRELRDRNAGVVFISHRLGEVLQVSDRLVVMRDGRIALDAPRADTDHRAIVRAMLGSEYREFVAAAFGQAPTGNGRARLDLRGWIVPAMSGRKMEVGPLDLAVNPGEVLGIFGPLGAGKSELLYSLFGILGREPRGVVRLDGEEVRIRSPKEAIAHGVALIPSDRRSEGIVSGLSVRDNMVLSRPPDIDRGGLLRHPQIDRICEAYARQLDIRIGNILDPIDHLSGGNQQKVLLARCLATAPKVMLLDEPTTGIDVGAKVDVYEQVRQLADGGTACLFASMEADEMLLVAERILVLRDGRPLALVNRQETNEHDLVHLATGGEAA